MCRKFLLTTLLLASVFYTRAQDPDLDLPDTLKVSHIAQEQNLSQLNVLAFDFDNNGYLWAGTEDGLNRFNGYSMKTFSQSTSEENGLMDDHIRGLLYTEDTLWLGTNTHSVQAYILSEDRFLNFKNNRKIASDPSLSYTHQVFEINDQYLMVSALKNCILIDRNSLELHFIPLPDITVNDYVLSILKQSKESIWLGSYFNGILKLDVNEMTIENLPEFDSFDNNPVHVFQNNGPNEIFIGTQEGLFQYSLTSASIQQLTEEEVAIRSFYDWDTGHFLVGCSNGLKFLDKNSHRLKNVVLAGYDNKLFSPVEILGIQEDAAKGVWMGSQGKGMFYFHPARQKFTPKRITLPKEPEKDFISIFNFLKEDDILWLATTIGYVSHDLKTGNYQLYRKDGLGYTLKKDANDQIWAGGFNQGLAKYNKEEDLFKEVTPLTNIPDRDVAEIVALGEDSLLVNTWSSGIYSLNPETLETTSVEINGKTLHRARTSFKGKDSSLWLGSDEGLFRIKNGQTQKFEHAPSSSNSLSNNRVFGITQDDKNNLWIGTAKGLNKLNLENYNITHYLEQPGLPNDFIYGVLADSNNDIWVSTNRGLSKLDHQTEVFTNYTEQDGLQNNEFNGKAAYKDENNNLYFGGMNGFNVFHPDSIPINKYVGKTIIEDVELFGNSIDKNIIYKDSLSFDYNENVITFNFSSLNFLLPEKNRYQFKMLGFDKQWRPVTKERSTTYTNLNPGTYTFLVKGSNNDLVWGEPDALFLTISAPWYATTLFKIFLTMAVLLLITTIFLFRYNQKKKENLRLQKMVEARTAELRRSNEDLGEAMNLANEQKNNIAFLMQELNHRVKNNLQLIASLLDIQKESIKDTSTKNNLQAAQNRLFTISTIHDLLSEKNHGDNFKLDQFIRILANELIQFMNADVDLKFQLEPLEVKPICVTPLGIIINELVTNTLKHAFKSEQKNKEISISLSKEGDMAKLEYFDNGIGIMKNMPKKEDSLGMNLIKNLALQLKGDMEIREHNGTHIIIRFKC